MNRRSAIRNVVVITAGASLLPSCFHKDNAASFPLKNISLTAADQDMLVDLTETIIPKTNSFIGAKDLKAHEFLMTMVDDCYKPEEQKDFTGGMKSFDKLSHDKSGQLFVSLTPQQKKELLAAIETKKDIPEDVLKFYGIVKKHTLQAFTSSKQYMTDVRHYKMVPGPVYKGCVPVKG